MGGTEKEYLVGGNGNDTEVILYALKKQAVNINKLLVGSSSAAKQKEPPTDTLSPDKPVTVSKSGQLIESFSCLITVESEGRQMNFLNKVLKKSGE
jgi:hypothetical protein